MKKKRHKNIIQRSYLCTKCSGYVYAECSVQPNEIAFRSIGYCQ